MLYRRSVTNKHSLSSIYAVAHFLNQHRQISINSANFMNNIVMVIQKLKKEVSIAEWNGFFKCVSP